MHTMVNPFSHGAEVLLAQSQTGLNDGQTVLPDIGRSAFNEET